MSRKEFLKYVGASLAAVMVPEHYGTFPVLEKNADSFVSFLKQFHPSTKPLVLKPGEDIFV